MGQKYLIRTNEERVYPLETVYYTDYYTNPRIMCRREKKSDGY